MGGETEVKGDLYVAVSEKAEEPQPSLPEKRGPECPICKKVRLAGKDTKHSKCSYCNLFFGYDHLAYDTGDGMCQFCKAEAKKYGGKCLIIRGSKYDIGG